MNVLIAVGCAVGLVYLLVPAVQAFIQKTHELEYSWSQYSYEHPERGYPLSVEGLLAYYKAGVLAMPPFDRHGIPVVDYRWMRWPEMPRGRYYNATTVAQYALHCLFQPYVVTRSERLLRDFLAQADWLVDAQGERGEYRNLFPLPAYGCESGWVSGMYQGQAASVLVRAYLLSGEHRYLAAARRALDPLLVVVDEGGALSVDDDGTWIEEVPEKEPSHILNGMIFAWWGLWDYCCVSYDPAIERLRDDVLATLKTNLWRYTDAHGGVRYELKRRHTVNNSAYLRIQVEQLRALHSMTGYPGFGDTGAVWARHAVDPARISLVRTTGRALRDAIQFRTTELRRFLTRTAQRG